MGVHRDSLSQLGSCLGSVKAHSLTLSYTSGSLWCDSRASSWPAPLQPLCLGREPKARVATKSTTLINKGGGWILSWSTILSFTQNAQPQDFCSVTFCSVTEGVGSHLAQRNEHFLKMLPFYYVKTNIFHQYATMSY